MLAITIVIVSFAESEGEEMATTIARVQVGTLTRCGTQWPIENIVQRVGARQWVVLRGLCNGVPRSSEEYRSRREALYAAGVR